MPDYSDRYGGSIPECHPCPQAIRRRRDRVEDLKSRKAKSLSRSFF